MFVPGRINFEINDKNPFKIACKHFLRYRSTFFAPISDGLNATRGVWENDIVKFIFYSKKLFAFLARDLYAHFDCPPVSTLIRVGSLCLIELSLHWSRVGLHSKLIQLRFICEINFFPAVNTSGSVNIVGGRKIEWRFAYIGLHRRRTGRKHVLNDMLINSTREEIY